ncbi:MAG TPA: hypothetical protein VMF31_09035 [Solirubrobacterales bacterium]|nr:hypothetical protein [Solirubrobacterales bacterium]
MSAVVSDFSDNIADGDYAAACDMYDSEAVEFFETQGQIPGGCEGLTEATFGSLSEDQVAGIEAESIDIEGDMATVQLVNGDEFGLRKEGDGWVMTLD